jgi:hypothetical protein
MDLDPAHCVHLGASVGEQCQRCGTVVPPAPTPTPQPQYEAAA